MGVITERDGPADGYEVVPVPPAPDTAAEKGAIENGANQSGAIENGAAVLRRRSALPSRRAVLYLHRQRDTFVPEDLVSWYTERGFHFYVVDQRPPDGLNRLRRRRRKGPGRSESFAQLDSACRHLRDAEGIDMIIVSAHLAGALTAAQWCDARRDEGLADALILSSPAFGRQRRGLDIACPVLVLSSAADGKAKRRRLSLRRRCRKDTATVRLGPHVTWLRLEDGLEEPGADADRRQFFDEMGRWLGAYMYGKVRDQLL